MKSADLLEFFRGFEYKLAQTGGNEAFTLLGKTQQLKASLNPRLRRSLIGVKLPPAKNFKELVVEVKEVAAELEGMPGYRPRNATETTTNIEVSKGGRVNSDDIIQPVIYYDGDTHLGDANALLAAAKFNFG